MPAPPPDDAAKETRSPEGPPRRKLLAWLVVLAAAAVLTLGWLFPDFGDERRLFRGLNWLSFMVRTFTPHGGIILLLLSLPVVLARAWRPAAALAGLGVLCIVPLLGLGSFPAKAAEGGAPSVKVMTINVMYGRVRDQDLFAELDRHAPDVVVIQEYTPEFHVRVRDALAVRLPHFSIAPRDDAFGMAIFSRLPFAGSPELYPALPFGAAAFQPSEPQIRAVVKVDDREVVVQGVHTLPPISPAYLSEQRRLCRGLAAYAQNERRPLVLAGDFNHTPSSVPAAWLRQAGLTDAHAAAGNGRGLTWPASGGLWSIAGLRLDQILISHGLMARSCHVGGDIGSDHRPVVAQIEVR